MNWNRIYMRLISRICPFFIWELPTPDPAIYLTFDDGPDEDLTWQVLEILQKFQIPAVFFMNGKSIEDFGGELAKLDYRGHRLANHGYFHQPLSSLSADQVKAEMAKTDELIFEAFVQRTNYFRPPYGLFGKGVEQALQSSGKSMVLWSLMGNEFKWPPDKVLQHLFKNTRNGTIAVFHDNPLCRQTLPEVLPRYIDWALEKGYRFKLL